MRLIPGILFYLLIYSCSDNNYSVSKPYNMVARDTLISILKELSIVESHVQDNYIHVGAYKELMKKSGEAILSKYGISPERFERTMDFYGTHQSEMISVYQQVLDSLNKEASRLPQDSLIPTNEPHNPIFKGNGLN
jgi:hypothetical protein